MTSHEVNPLMPGYQDPVSRILAELAVLKKQLDEISGQLQNSTGTPDYGGLPLAIEVTGLSASRIYALVSQKQIPHRKRGGRLFFKRGELLTWLGVADDVLLS